MTAGQVSDYTGAAALLDDIPKVQWLLGDRGYTPTGSGTLSRPKAFQSCIPGRRSRNESVRYDKRHYRRRTRIEIMFGCPNAFFSAITLAATVIFRLYRRLLTLV